MKLKVQVHSTILDYSSFYGIMMFNGNLSRAEVYSALVKYHQELSKLPTRIESLDTPCPKPAAANQKGSPKTAPMTSNKTCKAVRC